jgi:hypothetical protein
MMTSDNSSAYEKKRGVLDSAKNKLKGTDLIYLRNQG